MKIDNLEYNIYIGNDAQHWPDQHCPIGAIVIFNKGAYSIESGYVILEDVMNIVGEKFQLSDSTKIRIEINNGKKKTYNMRIAKVVRIPSGGVMTYKVWVWTDANKWFFDTTTKAYEGNSSDVISRLAQESGMKSDIDKTKDKQVWLGFGRKRHVFAKSVALHGYASDDSLMRLVYTDDKILYKDMNQIDTSKPVAHFIQGQFGSQNQSVPVIPIIKHDIISNSGVGNALGGFKGKMIDQEIMKTETKEFDKVSLKKRTKNQQRNDEVVEDINVGRLQIGPNTTDNTHANYAKAQYQNIRGNKMINETILLMTMMQTGINLLDPIKVTLGNVIVGSTGAKENNISTYDGPYIVDGKIISIKGTLYLEAIIARREGLA